MSFSHLTKCLYEFYVPWRYETCETAKQSKTDGDLREELLRKLIDRQLLGATQQLLVETEIERLPVRELPPGNTASLFLLYISYMRIANETAASKATFYAVAKRWSPCLRFRRRSEHSMCVECSRLKAAIQNCNESHHQVSFCFCIFVGTCCF